MKASNIAVASVLIAALVFGASSFRTMAQSAIPEATRVAEDRPTEDESRRPRRVLPSDRFFMQGHQSDAKVGWEDVLIEVPFGYWLVLTDASLGADLHAVLAVDLDRKRSVIFDTTTYQDHLGPWASAKSEYLHYSSHHGIAFAPGSKLVIRNGGNSIANIQWHLTGYYDEE